VVETGAGVGAGAGFEAGGGLAGEETGEEVVESSAGLTLEALGDVLLVSMADSLFDCWV
jgi:hypothetical protein